MLIFYNKPFPNRLKTQPNKVESTQWKINYTKVTSVRNNDPGKIKKSIILGKQKQIIFIYIKKGETTKYSHRYLYKDNT